VTIVDPRGVGALRPALEVRGHEYSDPLCGVEENLAYNAFLVGEGLLGIRVADVLAAVADLSPRGSSRQLVLCARRDAALVAILAAAIEPRIDRLAIEKASMSYLPLLEPAGQAFNAASISPRILSDFGDIPEVLAVVVPRTVLAAAPRNLPERPLPAIGQIAGRFTTEPTALVDWLSA
jgi:hypothetical protein